MNEEIRRLSVLVEEFNEPFRADSLVLNVYKKSLHSHVEAGLGSNLRSRLSAAVAMNIESSQQEMTKRMTALLGPDKQQVVSSLFPRREPFEVLYRLNCDNLCQDFKEDIEFKFSLGLYSMVRSLMGKATDKLLNTNTVQNVSVCRVSKYVNVIQFNLSTDLMHTLRLSKSAFENAKVFFYSFHKPSSHCLIELYKGN